MNTRRRQGARSVTLPIKKIGTRKLWQDALEYPEQHPRPRTRAECIDLPRPCVFVACPHNLYLDVNPNTGSIKFNFPEIEPDQMVESCALDVAARGGQHLETIAISMNMTRERVRQITEEVFLKMAPGMEGQKEI